MDAEKRDDLLRALDLYRDYAVEAGLFGGEHVGDLVDQAEGAGAQALGDVAEENVRKLRGGIKQAEAAE